MGQKRMGGNRSPVAGEAIRDPGPLPEWQIEAIKKDITEADRGEFAADEQVEESLPRWIIQAARKSLRRG